MIFRDIFDIVPFPYWVTVLGLTAAYLLWMALELIIAGARVRRLRRRLSGIESGILQHQGCQIENLPLISSVFDAASPGIGHAYSVMMDAAADYYQKKWIPDPAEYIHLSAISEPGISRFLQRRRHFLYAILGLLLTLGLFAAAFVLFTDSSYVVPASALAAFPFVIALFFLPFTAYRVFQWNVTLAKAFSGVHKALERRLPVFSENKGVSLLISQFIDYDRSMSGAVETLTDKIDRFAMDGLVTAVTSSIEGTLREAVFPSIERANDAILALSRDLAVRQDEGMKTLALGFTTALTTELAYHLKPFFDQIGEVSQTILDSKKYLGVISQTINIYKQNAQELHSLTAQTLKDYAESRKTFSADVSDMAGSLKAFSSFTADYSAKVGADVAKLEESIGLLSGKIDENSKALAVMLDAIFVEARNAEESAGTAQANARACVDSMQQQIAGHIADMARVSGELTERLQKVGIDMSDSLASAGKGLSDAGMELNGQLAGTGRELSENMSRAGGDLAKALSDSSRELSDGLSARTKDLLDGVSRSMDDFFRRQDEAAAEQHKKQILQLSGLLSSMEESAEVIRSSTAQIKASFDELEEARAREAEARQKKSIFRR